MLHVPRSCCPSALRGQIFCWNLPSPLNIHVERKPWPRVPIERHGRPRPCERRGPTIVGRMSASEPFDGTRDWGGDNYHVDNLCSRPSNTRHIVRVSCHDYFLVLSISTFDVPTVVSHSDGLRNPARNGFTSIRFLPANCKSVREIAPSAVVMAKNDLPSLRI